MGTSYTYTPTDDETVLFIGFGSITGGVSGTCSYSVTNGTIEKEFSYGKNQSHCMFCLQVKLTKNVAATFQATVSNTSAYRSTGLMLFKLN